MTYGVRSQATDAVTAVPATAKDDGAPAPASTGTNEERAKWMEALSLSEAQIQKAIMEHLSQRAPGGLNKVGGVLVIHPPNGGAHQATAGQRIFHANHGVLSGTPDLLLFHEGKKYALELKTLKGKLSAKQQTVGHLFRMQGFENKVAFGLFEALAWLERHGLLEGRTV